MPVQHNADSCAHVLERVHLPAGPVSEKTLARSMSPGCRLPGLASPTVSERLHRGFQALSNWSQAAGTGSGERREAIGCAARSSTGLPFREAPHLFGGEALGPVGGHGAPYAGRGLGRLDLDVVGDLEADAVEQSYP